MPTTSSPTPRLFALVLFGGAVGSATRHFLVAPTTGIPWAVLGVNLAGAVLAGFLVARVRRHSHVSRILLPLAVIGVAGALTTFSGLVVDTVLLADAGRLGDASVYAVSSIVLGPLAAAVGLTVGGRT